jgi:hypothetical protein
VWHIKEPSLLKAAGAKHRSKFAALSLAVVTVQIAEKLLVQLKKTNVTFRYTGKFF